MNLRKPNRQDIQVGNVVEIVDREGKTKGKAELVRRRPSRYIQDNLGYVKYERPNKEQLPTLYIWSYERWEVIWVEHPYYRPGDRGCVEVNFYVETTTDYPSFVDNIDGTKRAKNGLYIFLEEEGTLYLGDDTYSEEAIKAFQRIKRAIDGDIVIYTHNPVQVKARWDLNKMGDRILDFLPNDRSFSAAVKNFLQNTGGVEDYIVISGVSTKTKGDRVFNCSPTIGLKLKA